MIRHAMHEKAEKKNIITELLSPRSPSALTHVYARPAPSPPTKPASAGMNTTFENDGFNIKSEPANAAATAAT